MGERRNNFDLMRLFGAILVLYAHAYPLNGAPPPSLAANSAGEIGVKIFFSISGYLVALSWLRDPNLGRFLLRRSFRIFPALIAVVLLSAFVLGPLVTELSVADYFRDTGTYRYLTNIGLYMDYFLPGVFRHNVYPNAVNGSLWSLPAEFSMYLLTPLLIAGSGAIGGRRAFAIVGVLFIATAFWISSIEPRFLLVIYQTDVDAWLSVAPFFVMGALYAVCRLDRFLNIYVASAGLFVLVVFEMNAPMEDAALLLVLPYFTLSFGSGRAVLPLKSDLSYGLFLYGFPVEQTLRLAVGPTLGPWESFALAALISGCLGYLSWHLVEKRALTWKPTKAPAPVRVSLPSLESPPWPARAVQPVRRMPPAAASVPAEFIS